MRLRVLLAVALACVASRGWAAAPLEAYGNLPSLESVDISPDGTKAAVVISDGEKRMLGVKVLPDGQMQTYLVGEAKVRRLDWVGSERLILTTSRTGSAMLTGPRREYSMGFELNIATRRLNPLLSKPLSRGGTGSHFSDPDGDKVGAFMNVLAGPPEVRLIGGTPTLFLRGITFPERWGVLTILKVNLKTGESDIVELGTKETDDIVLGQDGLAVAKSEYDDDTGRWTLRLRDGVAWKLNRTVEAKSEPPFLAGLGRDGRSVVVGEMGDTGFHLREIGADGTWGDPLDAADADHLIFDPATHRLIGVYVLAGDEDRYTFFDPADQRVWNSVRAAFKGDRVHLESWSQDRSKIVVLVDSPSQGQAYALVDVATKQATWLGERYQKLTDADIGPVKAVRFKAKDGLELTGYLTLPNGAAAKNLPLIVFPHGGPASRDTPGFDWWAQAMASRGYAVLQVNFRGSDGFGWSFVNSGFGQWGRKMQTDLSDGVRDLAAQGVVDPKRVCIVGASYGGYAALAGAALDSSVYRCAVSFGGLSDLGAFVTWSDNRNGASAWRYWTRFMGAKDARDPALSEISPIAHIDQVKIPVLMIHGRDDTVVPLSQSEAMAAALKAAGKPVDLIVQKGGDHWLSSSETRLQMLTATMAFVEKNNPPN